MTPNCAPLALAIAAVFAAASVVAVEPAALVAKSKKQTPAPPWPAGDELGMANTLGAGTMARCAWHMAQAKAKTYELSYVRSDSPLLKLGMEKARPILTSAVLLDAKTLIGGGQPMKAGELVTAKHIEAMLKAQGLAGRGILPGDVVYVRTGWGDHWKDPDTEKFYYTKAPGLSCDAAKYPGERRIVAIGLDTPFVDPVPEGKLEGKAGPAPGVPDGLPFSLHHHMLTQMGIHHIENANQDELALDREWTSCTMVLPLREKGSAGSAIRPVAVGSPTAAR